MNIDERVRQALHHRAQRIEPGDGSWKRIQQRVDEARHRRRRNWAAGATGAVAAAVLLVAATLGLLGDGGDRVVQTGPAAPALPTSLPREVPAIWPSATRAELLSWAESGDLRHEDPAEAVRDFAVEYLGMVEPLVSEPSEPGPDGTLTVVVEPQGEGDQQLAAGPMQTVVHLAQGPPWQVLFTTSSSIRLDGDSLRHVAGSPITISGASTSYYGDTVHVAVREAGMEADEALGRGFVIGGGMGRFTSFAADIAFESPHTDGIGALVLTIQSAVDGSTLEATVVGLNFRRGSDTPATTAPSSTEFTVFFLRGMDLVPVTRSVPATTGVLRASLEALLAGPTQEERADGLHSMFSDDAALRGVSIDGDGNAVVDFYPWNVGNAGTSAGSRSLLEQLKATVFRFPTVTSVEYQVDGSCLTFGRYLESGQCIVSQRQSG